MPTLLRLLLVLGILSALVYGAMTALVVYFKPEPRDITQSVTLPSRQR